MKADKKTLMAVKQFLELREGLEELKEVIIEETNLLKHKEMGKHTLATDECGIEWGGDNVCVLSDFIDSYTGIFMEKICYVLDSFVDNDLSYYNEE